MTAPGIDTAASESIEEPPHDELTLSIPVPTSQGASRWPQEQLEAVRTVLSRYGFVLTGDVNLSITWMVPERVRYESDSAVGSDKFFEPLLDALCGPTGILVDECQLVSVSCGWIDSHAMPRLEVCVRYSPQEWFSKQGLVFVDFGRALCIPVSIDLPPEVLHIKLSCTERTLQSRAKLEVRGDVADMTSMATSGQRFFHRSKVSRFCIRTLDELRREMGGPRA